MLINLDFRNQTITVDNKKFHWMNGYYQNTLHILEQYSVLVSDMREFFVIDDFNYANLIMPLVYQNDYFFQKSPGMLTIYNYLDILDSLNLKGKVDFDVNDFYDGTFIKCALLVSKKKGFKTNILRNSYVQRKNDFIYENNAVIKNLLKGRIFMRYLFGCLRKICGRSTKNMSADVLFLSNIRFSRKNIEDNVMFGSVINELNNRKVRNKVLFYEEIIQLKNLKNLISNYVLNKGSYIGDYYSIKHFSRNRDMFKKLHRRWDSLKDNPDFKSKFVYNGYNFYDLIRPRLELVFNSLSYLVCDLKNISSDIIRVENYKVILTDHAENMLGKSFMLNTRLDDSRKTLAFSHEQIYPACAHTCVRNKKSLDKNSLLWRPLPYAKFVWGKYAKDILIKYCAYNSEVVKITGNPKFDCIFNTSYKKKDLIKKYPLFRDSRKKILIVSSNMFEQYALFVEIAQKNPDYLFIFKPHPNESMQLVSSSFKNAPKNIIFVDRFIDTYELIFLSDYVLMFNSTAGFEAMLFEKIVFMISYNNIEPDGIPFKGSGAIIEIRRGNDMKNALNKLKDKKFEKQLFLNMKKFVNYMHFKNDGKATVRVADEIEKIIKSKM